MQNFQDKVRYYVIYNRQSDVLSFFIVRIMFMGRNFLYTTYVCLIKLNFNELKKKKKQKHYKFYENGFDDPLLLCKHKTQFGNLLDRWMPQNSLSKNTLVQVMALCCQSIITLKWTNVGPTGWVSPNVIRAQWVNKKNLPLHFRPFLSTKRSLNFALKEDTLYSQSQGLLMTWWVSGARTSAAMAAGQWY